MATYVTWEDTVSNGIQTTYGIPCPFLDRDHVYVKFSGVTQPSTAYTFLSDSQISLVSPAPNLTTVRVGRLTPQTVQTDFQSAILPESDLDNGYLQALYHVQELQDMYDETVAAAISVQVSPLNNLAATVPPAVTDDSGDGYEVGSFWFDSVNKITYRASDVTVGAAVWNVVGGKSHVAATAPGLTDDADSGFAIGSHWWDTATGTIYTCTDATVGAAVWGSLAPSSLSYPLTHTGAVYAKESGAFSSATTVDLSTVNGNYVTITGNTGPIASFGTLPAGTEITIKFTGTPTVTHHATKIQMPADTSRVMAAGDIMEIVSDGTDAWTVKNIVPHTGNAIVPQTLYSPVLLESFSHTAQTTLTLSNLQTNYPQYRTFIINIRTIAVGTDDDDLILTVDYGAGFLATGYAGLSRGYKETGTAGGTVWATTEATILGRGQTSSGWGIGSAANEGVYNADIVLEQVNEAALWTPIYVRNSMYYNDAWFRWDNTFGGQESAGAVDGIKLECKSNPGVAVFNVTGALYGVL